jgi:nicotinate-nucleotide adenylyltransferase
MGLSFETIGLLGGSFDPIHVGHIALARAASNALKLDEIQLLPAGQPWQKAQLKTAAEHRLAMAEIAALAFPKFPDSDTRLSVNRIEIGSDKPTYTVETLETLFKAAKLEQSAQSNTNANTKANIKPKRYVLIIGSDQLRNFATWHRYQDILKFAHIAVTQRESVSMQGLPVDVEALVSTFGRDALSDTAAGSLVYFRMPPVAVSSTALRMALKANSPQTALVSHLLPAGVFKYISENQLYK